MKPLASYNNNDGLVRRLQTSALKGCKASKWYPVRLIYDKLEVDGFMRSQSGHVHFLIKRNDRTLLFRAIYEIFVFVDESPITSEDPDFTFPTNPNHFYAYDDFKVAPFKDMHIMS